MKPLVSVVIPNFNHAKYLEKRLDSVFNQTYDSFEVIILDDCSTDDSLQIINKYSDNPHLSSIVVNEQNSGSTFKQWDKGIQLTNGDLIWIAESDDYNELTFLEEMVNAFKEHEKLVLAFSSFVWFNDTGVIKRPKESKNQFYDGNRFIKGWMSIENAVSNASGAVFRKDAYTNITNLYTSFLAAGDYQLWVEMASQGECCYVRKNLTYFRKTPYSVTSTNMRSGNSILEDIRISSFVLSRYRLSIFQKQAMFARFSGKYRGLPISNEIRIIMNATWHSDKRQPVFDHYYLRTISIIRDHIGLLCI